MKTCEYCKSTNIHINKRGFNFVSGFIGSSNLIATCLDCGYKTKVINQESGYIKFKTNEKKKKIKKFIYTFLIILIIITIFGIIVR